LCCSVVFIVKRAILCKEPNEGGAARPSIEPKDQRIGTNTLAEWESHLPLTKNIVVGLRLGGDCEIACSNRIVVSCWELLDIGDIDLISIDSRAHQSKKSEYNE
jgi:hypothetical protein